MDLELICDNAIFSPEQLAFYIQFGVVTPIKDEIYTPRSITKNSNGDWEILLNEIQNDPVPIKHKILGISYKEVAWNLNRFKMLNGDSVSIEMIKELKKELV